VLGYLVPLPAFLDGIDMFSLRYGTDIGDLPARGYGAARLALFGAAVFFVSHDVRLRRNVGRRSVQEHENISWSAARMGAVLLTYSVVGASLFSYGVYRVGGAQVVAGALGDRIRLTQGLNYLFSAINLLPCAALAWWALMIGSERPGHRRWFAPFLAGALIATAFQGSKSIIFVVVVALVIARHRVIRPLRAWQLFAGAGGLFVVLTAYAIFTREYLAVGELVTLTDFRAETLWLVVRSEFVGNFIQLQTLAILLDKVPGVLPFQFGSTFLSLLALPIPRGLWPGKPITAPGVFTLAFWPDLWLNQGTSLPPGLFGEFFLNFGGWGLMIGAFLFGQASGTITAMHVLRPRQPYRLLGYALFVALIPHYIRGEFVSPTALFLILFLPAAFAISFASSRRVDRNPQYG
jgi:oligosaccharide repeat unit polymerase